MRVFLSYAGTERGEALRLRGELESRDVQVLMDDSFFRPGHSVMVNVGRAINSADLVVCMVSSDYCDRHFTEIEVSTVLASPEGLLIPVIFPSEPAPRTDRGIDLWAVLRGRAYFVLDWSPGSFDLLVQKIQQLASSRRRGDAATATFQAPQRVHVLYDWEDGQLLDDVEAALAGQGIDAASVTPAVAHDSSGGDAAVAVLWTSAGSSSPEVAEALLRVATAQQTVVYLRSPDAPAVPAGAPEIALRPPATSARVGPPRPRGLDRIRAYVHERLAEAVALNGGMPFHLLGDKFCANRAVAKKVEDAVRMAVDALPPRDPARLAAVLASSAVRRFRGDWTQARHLLSNELRFERRDHATFAAIAIETDRLSLDFELGEQVTDEAASLRSLAVAAGDWPSVIGIHRLLGMIYEEQGNHSMARDHMSRATHHAEDLLDTNLLVGPIPVRAARVTLHADCLRELAALEWRADKPELALEYLLAAANLLEAVRAEHRAADYLLLVVLYQMARVEYDMTQDYEKARELLQSSYRSLQTFDNPLRVATVLESLLRLEMQFLRLPDAEGAKLLRSTLEKVHRIHTVLGHDFLKARAVEALGDLEFALGHWQAAIDRFDAAKSDFNRLGKDLASAQASQKMGRCYTNLNEPESALEELEQALDALPPAPDNPELRAELRSEIARLSHRQLDPDQIDDETSMSAVGEFTLHRWIRDAVVGAGKRRAPQIILGVGDDAAVLGLANGEHLVLTTDSVPPMILATIGGRSVERLARFAVICALSDVVAMGAEPVALLANLHVRRSTSALWVRRLMEAMGREAEWYGATVVGGDLKEREREALTMVAVGRVEAKRVLTRSNARPGDFLAITVSSGPGQDLQGLGCRWAQQLVPCLSRHEREIIGELTTDEARYNALGLPVQTMRDMIDAGIPTAAADTSDGVLACAQLLGEASQVGVELFPNAIDSLINPEVRALARAVGIEPYVFALNPGFDWEVVFTVPKSRRSEMDLLGRGDDSGFPRAAIIGQIVNRAGWSEEGVRLKRENGSSANLPYFTDEKFRPRPHSLRAREWLDFARSSPRLKA